MVAGICIDGVGKEFRKGVRKLKTVLGCSRAYMGSGQHPRENDGGKGKGIDMSF